MNSQSVPAHSAKPAYHSSSVCVCVFGGGGGGEGRGDSQSVSSNKSVQNKDVITAQVQKFLEENHSTFKAAHAFLNLRLFFIISKGSPVINLRRMRRRVIVVVLCVCVSVCLLPQNQPPTSFLRRKQSFIGFFVVFSTFLPFGFP